MSVNGKFKDFTEEDLHAEADRFVIGTGPRVIDEVRDAIQAWPSYAAEAGVAARETERIREQLLTLSPKSAAA